MLAALSEPAALAKSGKAEHPEAGKLAS